MIDIEIAFIQALQDQAAWLLILMQFFSFLGQPEFYLLIIPAFYWCRDPRLGLRLGLLMGISGGLNEALKVVFHLPRPYWVSPDVRAFGSYPSFGLPSSHAQGAVTFWGLIAAHVRRWWFWISAVAIILLIGISRIFLAVHFPADVIVGFAVGAGTLLGFLALEGPVGRRIARLPLSGQVFVALAGSLALALVSVSALATLGDWQVRHPGRRGRSGGRGSRSLPSPSGMPPRRRGFCSGLRPVRRLRGRNGGACAPSGSGLSACSVISSVYW